ncbi:MAG: VWA domain-containing protein [Burkholderiaceae bacterium]
MEAVRLGVHHPWLLLLMVLVVLPFFNRPTGYAVLPSLALVPVDPVSRWLSRVLRLLGVILISALVLTLAGLHLKAQPYQHVSRGAEIAIVLDRSRSMDQRLVPRDTTIDWRSSQHEKKGKVAQRVLSQFVSARPDDHFSFVLFSTRPMPVSHFTREHDVIQAAIAASQTGRGISETELGQALHDALSMFEKQPFIGPRAILLVSDGGAKLDVQTRQQLNKLITRTRVGLYWIYLRSFRSPGLLPEEELTEAERDSVPEHFLHRYFQSTGAQYHAYEAESPAEMQAAIDDIKALEDRPIRYNEMRPVQELTEPLLTGALAVAGLLAMLMTWLDRSARRITA